MADYELLHLERSDGVCWITVDAPPINVMTVPLFLELVNVSSEMEADDSIGAVVLQSANPEFFIAHFDVSRILEFPTDKPPEKPSELGLYHLMCERFRTMPKATIAKIGGRVGGGGSELAASLDMRFGVLGSTIVNQMEVPLGILPGGSGTQRLPRLLGRGRAMEVILGGIDLDAATAERWGYLNRAFATVAEMSDYVDNLARRIASFPRDAVRLAKEATLFAEPDPAPGLLEEAFRFTQTLHTAEAPIAMRAFLDAGGQTREVELRIGAVSGELARRKS